MQEKKVRLREDTQFVRRNPNVREGTGSGKVQGIVQVGDTRGHLKGFY